MPSCNGHDDDANNEMILYVHTCIKNVNFMFLPLYQNNPHSSSFPDAENATFPSALQAA